MSTTTTTGTNRPDPIPSAAAEQRVNIIWSERTGYCLEVFRGNSLPDETDFYDRHGQPIDRSLLVCCGVRMFHAVSYLGPLVSLVDSLATLDARYSDHGYTMIHLADDEWENDTMRRVADEHFAANPDCQYIECHEHGGWWLCYRRDGSLYGTANDVAVNRNPYPRPGHGVERVIRRGKGGTIESDWRCPPRTPVRIA